MPTPDRCPLCGGAQHDRYRACDNPACELPVKIWPRVAELVALRDAAVAWGRELNLSSMDCYRQQETHAAYWNLRDRCVEHARPEADNPG